MQAQWLLVFWAVAVGRADSDTARPALRGYNPWGWPKPWPSAPQRPGESPSLGCDPRAEIDEAVDRLRASRRFVREEYCDGVRIEMVQHEADYVGIHLLSAGKRLPSVEQVEAVTRTHQFSDIYGVNDVSAGSRYCRPGTPTDRGSLSVNLLPCSTPLDVVANAIMDVAQNILPGISIPLAIGVYIPKPRCEENDEHCGPIPYHKTRKPPRAGARRAAVVFDAEVEDFGRTPGTACAHDGDCIVVGCGNQCVSFPFMWIEGTCPGLGRLEHSLCGCVYGLCSWYDELPLR